jgi:uncharacterized membrane protein YraQ (UPF0718 family)
MDLELSWIQALQAWLQTPFLRSFVAFQARWLIVGVGITSIVAYVVERGAVRRHAWKELGWSVGLAAVTALASVVDCLQKRVPFWQARLLRRGFHRLRPCTRFLRCMRR